MTRKSGDLHMYTIMYSLCAQVEEEEVGETSPLDLWTGRPITRGPLRKKWFLKETREGEGEGGGVGVVPSSSSHLTTDTSLASSSSTASQIWTESVRPIISLTHNYHMLMYSSA